MNEVIAKSVTSGDIYPNGTPVFFSIWTPPQTTPEILKLLPDLNLLNYSRDNDFTLKRTVAYEPMWASSLNLAITKQASSSWDVESKITAKRNGAQDLLHTSSGGKGWVNFVQVHLMDYCLAMNGAHIEIIRATSGAGSQIIGLVPLDSARCLRTGDPDRPIIYRSLDGELHELKDYQVISLADMPLPGATYNGVGFCAAARAYDVIRHAAVIRRYMLEKISGNKPLAINLVSGLNETTLRTALFTAENERAAKGGVTFGGQVTIPFLSNNNISHVAIPLAGLPDNFDRKTEADEIRLEYANALGVGLQTLQPLSGQGLGTGTQSEVLNDKERGQGLAAWRSDIAFQLNEKVFPNAVTFAFNERDYRDEKQKADIRATKVTEVTTLLEKGVIDANEARQMLVDYDVIPREMLKTPDQTLNESLASDEKPLEEDTSAPPPTLLKLAI